MAYPKNISMLGRNYDMLALQEVCDEDRIEEMERQKGTTNKYTPLPSLNAKKIKKNDTKEKQVHCSPVTTSWNGYSAT